MLSIRIYNTNKSPVYPLVLVVMMAAVPFAQDMFLGTILVWVLWAFVGLAGLGSLAEVLSWGRPSESTKPPSTYAQQHFGAMLGVLQPSMAVFMGIQGDQPRLAACLLALMFVKGAVDTRKATKAGDQYIWERRRKSTFDD